MWKKGGIFSAFYEKPHKMFYSKEIATATVISYFIQ